MKLSAGGKQAHPARIFTREYKPVFRIRRFPVPLINSHIHASAVAETVHQEYHVHLLRLLLLKDSRLAVFYHGLSLFPVSLFKFLQFLHDHLRHGIPSVQNILITVDIRHRLLMLFHQSLQLQPDQLIQPHLQNRVRLLFRKHQLRRHGFGSFGLKLNPVRFSFHQTCFCHRPVFGASENFYHQIDHIAGLDQPLLDLLPFQFLFQQVVVFSGCHFILEIHALFDDRFQAQRFRPAVADRQHIHPEGIFQPGLFIEHVDKILNIRVPAQFYDNADSLFGGLVCDIHDIHRLFGLRQRSHIGQKLTDTHPDHCIGNFSDHHIGPSAFSLFNIHFSPDLHLSCPGFIDLRQFILVDHNTAGRKIRSFHIPHQFPCGNIVIIHIGLDRIDHLAQIMRRDAGRHSYRNPLRTVHQKIGHLDGQHRRLFFRLVKIGDKIHHILVQIRKKGFLRDLLQPRLGITLPRRPPRYCRSCRARPQGAVPS